MHSDLFRAALPLTLLAVLTTPAAAAGGATFALSGDHQDYTRGYGTRTVVSASARLPVAPGTTLQLGAASGERVVGGNALRSSGFTATLQTPLSKGLSSRTLLTRGQVGPLFAARSAGEELVFKVGSTELRGGARLTRYGGGLDVRSAHAGLVREFGPVKLDYSLAAYARQGALQGGTIHRLEGAMKDVTGSTHLLLAAGSSLHEHDYRPDKVTGSFRFAGIKRKQALGAGVSIELTGGWTAFNRPKGKYGAARVGAGLVLAR